MDKGQLVKEINGGHESDGGLKRYGYRELSFIEKKFGQKITKETMEKVKENKNAWKLRH